MGTISPDLSGIVDGQIGDAVDWTNPINTITDAINGGLDTANFTAGATNISTIAQEVAASTWTPTFGGFSVAPVVTDARYFKIGKLYWFWINMGQGTSNATTFTMTLPAVAKTDNLLIATGNRTDNGSAGTLGSIVTAGGSATANVYANINGAAWTSSGGKSIQAFGFFEAN